jgi:glutamate synthase domain-containing protein 3
VATPKVARIDLATCCATAVPTEGAPLALRAAAPRWCATTGPATSRSTSSSCATPRPRSTARDRSSAATRSTNRDRSLGARSPARSRAASATRACPRAVQLRFRGAAGQSFGAFTVAGMRLTLVGEAQDYVGKGMSGGELVLRPPEGDALATDRSVILGNTALYGATGGACSRPARRASASRCATPARSRWSRAAATTARST